MVIDQTKIKTALEGNLIEELGLTSLPEAEKLRLLDSWTELIGVRTMARIADNLSDTDGETFAKIIEKESPEETVSWLQAHGVKFEDTLLEEVARLKDELRERARKVDEI